uniref:Uncharacterized protein n=1 Tax=Branchiostoma floridae TaxID=7739 RepID=C3ZEA8_BRAFL|eukprot:XP_002593053.1 hypothetical protein BRAFLDRAFT_74380 [Branchiostoma floridae]
MDSGNTLQRSISMTSEDGSGSERRNSEDREAYVEKMRKWYLEMWHSEAKKVKQQGDEMKMIEDSLIDYFTMVAKADPVGFDEMASHHEEERHLNENVLKELGKEWIDTRPTEIIESQTLSDLSGGGIPGANWSQDDPSMSTVEPEIL